MFWLFYFLNSVILCVYLFIVIFACLFNDVNIKRIGKFRL